MTRASTADRIAAHVRELGDLTTRVVTECADATSRVAGLIVDSLEADGKVLFCGNGGSAADAQHLAAEYVVRFRRDRRALAALALTTDTSILTAGGNDFGYDSIFERQVRALGRPGDVLVLHSTSGESPNLLSAAEAARECGLRTVAFVARGGGLLKDRVDVAVVVPTDVTARAQEIHLCLGHAVCDLVDRHFAGEGDG